MKTTAKDVILLCKGWYDQLKYPTILEALKQYYRVNYSDQFEDQLDEKYLLNIILLQTMQEIAKDYPDRLIGFINLYLFNIRRVYRCDENNRDYDYQLFYRIVNYLGNLRICGNGFKAIETEDYLDIIYDDEGNFKSYKLKEDII